MNLMAVMARLGVVFVGVVTPTLTGPTGQSSCSRLLPPRCL